MTVVSMQRSLAAFKGSALLEAEAERKVSAWRSVRQAVSLSCHELVQPFWQTAAQALNAMVVVDVLHDLTKSVDRVGHGLAGRVSDVCFT